MQENRLAIRPTMDELKTGDILAGMTDAELDARYKENPEQHALDLYVRLIPVIGEIGAKATETPPYPYLSRTFPDLEAQASSRGSVGGCGYH